MTRIKRNTPPDTNSRSVFRGGSWISDVADWVRAASRIRYGTAFRYSDLGFRCSLAGRMKR